MHVRMPLGEGCDKEQLVAPYPPHPASPLFQRGLRFGPAFRGRGDVAHDSSLWERQVMHVDVIASLISCMHSSDGLPMAQVMPQVAKALVAAVLLARNVEPLALHRRLQASGASYRRVLMLSPDFIVDDSGAAFLEEVRIIS